MSRRTVASLAPTAPAIARRLSPSALSPVDGERAGAYTVRQVRCFPFQAPRLRDTPARRADHLRRALG